MHEHTQHITDMILQAAEAARRESSQEPEPALTRPVQWPIVCTIGPGLEGAIACESSVGYVNGSRGCLSYRGYDIFDLCAHSTFEEVSYLLLHGRLPSAQELAGFTKALTKYRAVPKTMRLLMSFPVEHMNTMAALRLGTNLMRQELTSLDQESGGPDAATAISSDEDSTSMESAPEPGRQTAVGSSGPMAPQDTSPRWKQGASLDACCHLIAGTASIAGAIRRLRAGDLPLEADPNLSHAGNLLYMMTGRPPTADEERIMDVALILHADHGMNASTFAAMVVASTMADFYFAVGAGIGALSGPLHGGANEEVLHMLREIGDAGNVKAWCAKAREQKRRIMGFGHRVYKAYDPRARILGPLAAHLAESSPIAKSSLQIAHALEAEVAATLGREKTIFPNVDFYSGLVYQGMQVPAEMFTPIFAVSRVTGWTARVWEYVQKNRIFRPRAAYVGDFGRKYMPLAERKTY